LAPRGYRTQKKKILWGASGTLTYSKKTYCENEGEKGSSFGGGEKMIMEGR